MVKLRFTADRIYLAAAVSIAISFLWRSQNNLQWTPQTIQIAMLADTLVLACLWLIHSAVKRLSRSNASISRINELIHLFAGLAIILVTYVAHALFAETGETLNFDMLLFFATRFSDLQGVAAGSLRMELGVMLLLFVALIGLAVLSFVSKPLASLRILVLLLPVGLVIAGPAIQPAAANGELEPEIQAKVKRLYRGQYSNIGARQIEWNDSGVAAWSRGIVTGLPVSSLGMSVVDSIARERPLPQLYQVPQNISVSGKRPNVLLIVLESFRYDVIGAYIDVTGSKSNTPFLDEIAKQGWMVERAYTTVTHTSKALIGIYCGTFPLSGAEIAEAVPGRLPLHCLPHMLGKAGYRSAHFQTATGKFEDRLHLLQNVGFDDRFTQESYSGKWTKLAYLGIDDHAMIDPAISWMRAQKQKGTPFFASMLTLSTHHPYVTPLRIGPIHNPNEARAAYEDAVRYTDKWLRELFGKLRREGLLDNTLVIVTGDHGEGFGEHGLIAHNGTGYEEGIRVPMLLYGAMLKDATIVPGLRQHIDIMPTVLDFAGIGYEGKLPGTSLRADKEGHPEIVASCFYRNYCLAHLSSDGWKTFYFYGKRNAEVYDLRRDPLEQYSLYSESLEGDTLKRIGLAVRMRNAYEAAYD